jgi:hypothetical protein
MLTPAQAKRQRAELMGEIAQEERRKQRALLAELKTALRRARAERRGSLAEAKAACKRGRKEVRARIAEMRARALADLRAAVAAEKELAKQSCATGLEQARELQTKHDRARAALAAERKFRAGMRRIERGNRARLRELAPRARARELRTESDDTVRQNIPPELAGLFERVKSHIRGTDRMSRTEAFLHYAEEHPEEVLVSIEDRADALVRELEAKEREARRALSRPVRRAKHTALPAPPREVYADLAPF